MKKSICALFVALSILLMMGCAASTKDAADVETKNDPTEVSVDSENDNTESSATKKEAVDENTDTSEISEEGDEEEPKQEPELSEEEKHAALMEKINQQIELCEMFNTNGMGLTYSCFYDEKANSFTYNETIENGSDSMAFSSFEDFINSANSSSKMFHDSFEIVVIKTYSMEQLCYTVSEWG